MKALIVTAEAKRNDTSSDARHIRNCIASLQANRIEIFRANADSMPSDSAVNTYDFIVFPETVVTYNALWSAVINDSGITVPMLSLGTRASTSSGLGSNPGVTGSSSANVDRWINPTFSSSEWFALSIHPGYTISDGTALMTVAANDTISGSAQTDAGDVVVWSGQTAGGGGLYCSSVHGQQHQMLCFLIAMAIKDGKITNPVPQKIPFCIDLDHPNGDAALLEDTILDTIASIIPAGGMMWGGLADENTGRTSGMPSGLLAKLLKYQESGKFKYCYHNHSTAFGDIMDGVAWPNAGSRKTKLEQETQYDLIEAQFNSVGIFFDVNPGHMNPGRNMWDDNSLALWSTNITAEQDGAGLVNKSGKGYVSTRAIDQTSRYNGSLANVYTCQHYHKKTVHGITIFRGYNVGKDSGGGVPTNVAEWQDLGRQITHALSFGTIIYLHDEDFAEADQDPGANKHGVVMLNLLADIGVYLNDVCVPFADITKFVTHEPLDMS